MNSLFSFLIAPRVTEKFASVRVKIPLSPFPSFVSLHHGRTNIYIATNNAFQVSFVRKKRHQRKEIKDLEILNTVSTIMSDDLDESGVIKKKKKKIVIRMMRHKWVYITRVFVFKDTDRSYTFYLYVPRVHANTV